MPLFATGFEAGSKEVYQRLGWIIQNDLTREYTHRRDGYGGDWCCVINQGSVNTNLYTPVDPSSSGRWVHYWLDRGSEDTWSSDFMMSVMKGGNVQFSVGVADDGTINLYRGTNTLVASSATTVDMTTGHWFAVEVVVDNSGFCNVYVDDDVSAIVSFTGDTAAINPATGGNWDQVRWGANIVSVGYVDDIIITDATEGRYEETFAKSMTLNSDVASGLTPSAGSSNVDNVKTFDNSTYNSTSSTTTEDLYGLQGNLNLGDVRFLYVGALVASQGDFQVQTVLHSGSTNDYGSLTAAGTSDFGGILQFYLVDPDTTLGWTSEGVNALQVGVRSGT